MSNAPAATRSRARLGLAWATCLAVSLIVIACDRGDSPAEPAPATPPSSAPAPAAEGEASGAQSPEALLQALADALARGELDAAAALYHPSLRGAAARELDDFDAPAIAALRAADKRVELPPEMIAAVRERLAATEVVMLQLAERGRPAKIMLARTADGWCVADID
ncbi:MAG: hypothetical protein KC468_25015 [Myxococcales bacterium]|nr:hypothetical protein [Myxococcales bacterium]